jgi:hypothetical protein
MKVAGYVSMDGRENGVILPDSYIAFRRDDGTIVPLPHPVENSTLEQNGGEWRSAARNGRILHVEFLICLSCVEI